MNEQCGKGNNGYTDKGAASVVTMLLRKFEQDNILEGKWSALPFSPLQIEYLRLRGELVVLPPLAEEKELTTTAVAQAQAQVQTFQPQIQMQQGLMQLQGHQAQVQFPQALRLAPAGIVPVTTKPFYPTVSK